MQAQSGEFRQKPVARLFAAIVNHAILDLEDAHEAEAAERWLLSTDFDELHRVFC